MMKSCVMLLLLCAITKADELTLETESDEMMKTGDLEQAETKDASATEIIKQIRKVNADGTYTIGFEADDGTFKIETRDLQVRFEISSFTRRLTRLVVRIEMPTDFQGIFSKFFLSR